MLAFGIAHATADPQNINQLYLIHTRDVQFATGELTIPNKPFHFGFSKASDDTPDQNCCVARNFDDRLITGDWTGTGFSTIGAAQNTEPVLRPPPADAPMRFLLDTDRDTTPEFSFRFQRANDNLVVGNFDGLSGDDIGVVRNNGSDLEWRVTLSSVNPGTAFPTDDSNRPVDYFFRFGGAGNQALTGRFDRDNIDDLVVVRNDGDSLLWTFRFSAGNSYPNDGSRLTVGEIKELRFGPTGSTPIIGDWNEDGQDDIGYVVATAGQLASWTLSTLIKGSLIQNQSQNFLFGQVQAGQANFFLTGKWATNYFHGGSNSLVSGPLLTNYSWSDDSVWSNGTSPSDGQKVVVDQQRGVGITFDAASFKGILVTQNPLTVTNGTLSLDAGTKLSSVLVTGGSVELLGTAEIETLTVQQSGNVSVTTPQKIATVNLEGGSITIGYKVGNAPLGSTTSFNVRSGGSIFASAIPANESLIDVSNYDFPYDMSIVGELALGNTSSTALDANERENKSYLVIRGKVSGAGSIRKSGKGTVLFTGDNSYSGNTVVDAGQLIAGSSTALGAVTAGTRINNGALGILPEPDKPFNIAEAITIGSTGSVDLRRRATLSGKVTLEKNAVLQVEPSIPLTSGIELLDSATIELIRPLDGNPGSAFTLNVPMTGVGDLNWVIPASFFVDVQSTSTRIGMNRIRGGGTLRISVPNAFPASEAVELLDQSVLNLNSSSLEVSGLLGNGNVELSSVGSSRGALTVQNSQSNTFSGAIVGTGDAIKRGSGSLVLSGTNRLSGELIVESGSVELKGDGTQISTVQVSTGSRLDVSGQDVRANRLSIGAGSTATIASTSARIDTLLVNGLLEVNQSGSVVGQLDIRPGGILRMRGAFAGGSAMEILIDGGRVELESNEPFINAPITIQPSGATFIAKLATGGATFNNPISLLSGAIVTFDWEGAGSPSVGFGYSGSISGTGGLRKAGLGFLNLIAASTYSGATSVDAGELLIGRVNPLPTSTALSVASDAIVNMEERSLEVASISGFGTIQGKTGSVLTIGGTNADSAFGGRLISSTSTIPDIGSLSIRKIGSGRLTLSGRNSYTGTTTLAEGETVLQGSEALPDTSPITITGGTLDFNNTNETIASISNSGTLRLGSGQVRVLRDFVSTGTLNASTGTIEFVASAASQQLSLLSGTFNNALHSGAGTLILATNISVSGTLTNQTGAIDLNGSRLTSNVFVLNSGSVIDNAGSGSLSSNTRFDLNSGSVSVPLTGSANLTKSTDGEVLISGANSYAGVTTIAAGTLNLQGGVAAPDTSPITITGGILNFNNTNETIASISSSGTLRLGSGQVRVLRDFVSTGTLDASTGTLEFAASEASQQLSLLSGTLNNALHSGAGTLILATNISVSGTLTNQTGAIDLNGSRLTSNVFVLNGGSVIDNAGSGSLSSNTRFDLNSGSISVPLTGSANLTKSTDGEVLISGANSYAGVTTISAGKLNLRGGVAVPDASPITITGGILNFNNTNETIALISNSGTLRLGSGQVRVLRDFISTGTLDASTGTLEFAASAASQQLSLLSGTLNNALHSGAGTLILATNISVSGTLTNQTGAIDLNGSRLTSNVFVLNGGSVIDNAGSGSLSSSTRFDLNSGSVSVPLTGSANLTKLTDGEVLISGANSYAGVTTIAAGTLNLQGGVAVPDASPITITGGVLDFNNTNETIASISNSGALRLGSGQVRVLRDFVSTGTLDASTGTIEFAASAASQQLSLLSGALNNALHSGAGTLILATNISVSGTLTNQTGAIDLNGSRLTSNVFVLNGGSVIDNAGSGSLLSNTRFDLNSGSISVPLTGSGSLSKSTDGTVLLTSTTDLPGPILIREGTLRRGSDQSLRDIAELFVARGGNLDINGFASSVQSLSGNGQIDLGNGQLVLNIANSGEFGGVIGGTGSVTKTGAGTFSLSGTNRFQGDTQVINGTLVLSSDDAISESEMILIENSGTIEVRSSKQTLLGLKGQGSLNIANGELRLEHGNRDQTFAGRISGNGLIFKEGSASVTLSGTGDFNGGLNIASGTLRVDGQFPSADPVIQNGAMLQGTGTLGDVIVLNGGELHPGNSPGRMIVNSLLLEPGSTLVFEINGTTAGLQYDQLVVNESAILRGNIEIQFTDPYYPLGGEQFDLITYRDTSGAPLTNLPVSNGLVLLRTRFSSAVFRLLVFSVAEVSQSSPGNPSTKAAIDVGFIAAAPSSRQIAVSRNEPEVKLISTFLKKLPKEQGQILESTEWIEQPIALIPLILKLPEEVTVDIAVDALFENPDIADFGSFVSDVQPYAEELLDYPTEKASRQDPPFPISQSLGRFSVALFRGRFARIRFTEGCPT